MTGLGRQALLAACFCVLLFGGCFGSREAADEAAPAAADPSDLPMLAPRADEVASVQLYRTGDERNLPVVTLGGQQTLTLEFDLLGSNGRPLSVYFYHADRDWRRDLTPSEYLGSFFRDELIDYELSQATEVRYAHYTYRFPNNSIELLLSGNYVVRVTEQGLEEDVLFERPFFVSEQTAPAELAIGNVIVPGSSYPAAQPFIRFTPPTALQGNLFDFGVCFVRNGRLDRARCADRPEVSQQPELAYNLDPQDAFVPQSADYFLDLSNLRVGDRIERTDFSVSPFQLVVEPDYAKFGAAGAPPLLSGQTVISQAVQDVVDADVSGQYVNVQFAFVPPEERPLAGRVAVSGSFNDWTPTRDAELVWNPDEGRYEGTLLLKQGQYEYRYELTDRRAREVIASALPQQQNLYTAFVYFDDITRQTDRLLAVEEVLVR